MKAKIYINRHVIRANKKATKESGRVVDNPAIAVRTYKGSTYCKRVELAPGISLVQDAENADCSGATIWIEANNANKLILN